MTTSAAPRTRTVSVSSDLDFSERTCRVHTPKLQHSSSQSLSQPQHCPYGLATCSGCTNTGSDKAEHSWASASKKHLARVRTDQLQKLTLERSPRGLSELAKIAHHATPLLVRVDVILLNDLQQPNLLIAELLETLQASIHLLQRWLLSRCTEQPYVSPYESTKLKLSRSAAPLDSYLDLFGHARKYCSREVAFQHVLSELFLLILREAICDISNHTWKQIFEPTSGASKTQLDFFARSADESANNLCQSISYLQSLHEDNVTLPANCITLLVCSSLLLAMRWYRKSGNARKANWCADFIASIQDGHLYASMVAVSRASACEALGSWIENVW